MDGEATATDEEAGAVVGEAPDGKEDANKFEFGAAGGRLMAQSSCSSYIIDEFSKQFKKYSRCLLIEKENVFPGTKKNKQLSDLRDYVESESTKYPIQNWLLTFFESTVHQKHSKITIQQWRC